MEFRDYEAEAREKREREERERQEAEAKRKREEEERNGTYVEYFDVPEANYNLKEKAYKKSTSKTVQTYVLSPRMTEADIRKKFYGQVQAMKGVDAEFVRKVKKGEVQVEQVWFEVWYGETTETRRQEIMNERTTYYGTPDSTGEIRISHKTESYGTGRYTTYNAKVKKYTSAFPSMYYSTVTQNAVRLLKDPKNVTIVYAPYRESFKNKGSDLEVLEQVLLWPIWRVSVEYIGETYVNYLSDETGRWSVETGMGIATLPIKKTYALKKEVCAKPGFWRNFFKALCIFPIAMGVCGTFGGPIIASYGNDNLFELWPIFWLVGSLALYFGLWCNFYAPYKGLEEKDFTYVALIKFQGSGKMAGKAFRNDVCPIMSAFGWILSFALMYVLFFAGN